MVIQRRSAAYGDGAAVCRVRLISQAPVLSVFAVAMAVVGCSTAPSVDSVSGAVSSDIIARNVDSAAASASLAPTQPPLGHSCPALGVDAEDRILVAGWMDAARLRPRSGADHPFTWAFGVLLEAGHVGPRAVFETRWFDTTIASSPTARGALVSGVVDGAAPCDLGYVNRRRVVTFFDSSGACVFGVVDGKGTLFDALAMFDDDHIYVGGVSPSVDRYDRTGRRVFRHVWRNGYLNSYGAYGGPVPDWGFQRIVATAYGVVSSHEDDDGRARVEALSERGQTRWSVELPKRAQPAWLAADAFGNVYASSFVNDPLKGTPMPGGGMAISAPGAGTGPGELHVMKIDPKGRVVWTRTFRDDRHVYVLGLAADRAGDVWLLGLFFEKVALGGRFDLERHSAPEGTDWTAFVARLGSADGQTHWARTVGEVRSTTPDIPRQPMLFAGPKGDVVMKLESVGPLRNVPPRPPSAPQVEGDFECSVLRLRSAGATTEMVRVW